MAQVTGTATVFSVGSAGGVREDLEDKIWDLFAEDTYALTNFPHVTASNVYHEWLKDNLSAAGSNSALEGDDPTYSTLANPTRVGNYCQISDKNFLVSGTLETVSKAGRAREAARQAMKKMRELKNDMEFDIVRNHASMAGDTGSARSSAGMESWIATNDIVAQATSLAQTTPGFLSGIVAAPTDGTQGTATEGAFKSVLAAAWAQGGDARIILTNTSTKAIIDGFSGIVTRNIDMTRASPQQAAIIGAANVYVSSYGTHTVVLHRHVRGNVIMAIDPESWAIAFLRNPHMEEMAKTGDARKYVIRSEWTLVCRNEEANGKLSAVT
jgi:hypothetical protein